MNIGLHGILQRLVLLDLRLTTQTGLHIGAGKSLEISASNLPVVKDGSGLPLIPGSSLRGILRTGVEMIVASLGLQPQPEDPDQIAASGDFADRWSSLSVAERIFGRAAKESGDFSYASRLHVSDAACVKFDSPFEVRDGVAISRETRTVSGSAKFDFEVVPAGNQFHARIRFKNPQDYELGLLAQSLWMLNEGMLQLGGGSARGLGWMSVECGQPRDLDVHQIIARTAGPEEIEFGPVEERLAGHLQALHEFVAPRVE